MKMVKSLLLGTAAGLVAIAGAQAADLPVKAKPVQYVKICSLYGAGFYYIPGTDTCIKVGGWVRQYIGVNANGDLTNGAMGSGNLDTRASDNGWTFKSRGYITADARTQTPYGTLRGYFDIGESTANGVATVASTNRAFIQLAGFTLGITQSFYDLYPTPALSYFGGMINPSSDTGDGGQTVTAYTAQFGGGMSATISAEAPRNTTVVGPLYAWKPVGALDISQAQYNGTGGAVTYPDVVGNLRMDAPWGSAQVMGAIHNASGLYYGANNTTGDAPNATGWVIGAGILLKAPSIGPGDYFSAQVNYSEGAPGYINTAAHNQYDQYQGLTSYGLGVTTDGVYGVLTADTGMHLTTSWGVNAGYEHHWNQSWQTSLYGAYIATSYDNVANLNLCFREFAGGLTGLTPANCNNDWSYWDVGSRTQFNVDSQTYIGVDVIYTRLNTASAGVVTSVPGSGTQSTQVRTLSDQSAWMAEFRFHRNFYP